MPTLATYDSGQTWRLWTDTGTTSSLATTVWVNWNSDTTTATTADVWGAWNAAATYTTASPMTYQWPVQGWTAEQQAEAERRRRQYECEARARERERKAAQARARVLLLEQLSAEQRETYERERYFDVLTPDGTRRYRVMQGQAGNVRLLDAEGRVLRRYCIHPREQVPDEDAMLGQKLMLECGEEEAFLRIANAS